MLEKNNAAGFQGLENGGASGWGTGYFFVEPRS